MSYENIFNELNLVVLRKSDKKVLCEFDMTYNYTDAKTFVVPEVDVHFITSAKNEFEENLQDELTIFAQHSKNRKKFMEESELTVVYDESNYSFSFQEESSDIKNSDIRCPFCKSDEIEGTEVNMEVGECSQDMFCIECEREWTNIYRLESYTTN